MEDGPSTHGSTKRGKRQPKPSVKAVAVLEDSREKDQQKKAREVKHRKRKPVYQGGEGIGLDFLPFGLDS